MRLNIFVMLACVSAIIFSSCSGKDGINGEQGIQGESGKNGTNGNPGSNGIDCWDINGDGINDSTEDVNGDQEFNGLDCQGTNGANGGDGNDGIDCWDTNGNGVNDDAEDINNDNNFDGLDCQGEQGEQGNANVQVGHIDMSTFSGIIFGFNLLDDTDLDITIEELPNYVFFYYIEYADTEKYYNAPGRLYLNVTYVRTDEGVKPGDILFLFYETSDDGLYQVPIGEWNSLKIVALEISLGNKNGNEVLAQLKAAGIDTDDYNAVMAYFGLEE